MTNHVHHAGCGCMTALSRRSLFGMGVAAGAVAMATPRLAFAQKPSPTYEAMLMNCIDPRFSTNTWAFMGAQDWQNLYSQFTIAGGPIAAVAPVFEPWRKAWWDNLEISIALHQVKRVIGLCHRDCGAAAVAYGDQIKTDPAFETAKLTEALRMFRDEVKKRQPKLDVQLGIIALNGAVQPIA
jgi:carbonic anhydrase